MTADDDATFLHELKRAINDKYVNTVITFLLGLVALYLAVISVFQRHIFHPLTGDEFDNVPVITTIVSLLFLLVCALALGWIVSIIKLPPLFGCILVGIAFGNISLLSETFLIGSRWEQCIRLAALAVIVVRWGFGVDLNALKERPVLPFALGFLTPLAEAAAVTLAAHLLFGVHLALAILCGFLLAAVSPAVTVPVMLALNIKKRGVDQGIPSLVLAVSSVDNLICIAAFTTILTIIFTSESLAVGILLGILQVIAGVFFGVIAGLILWWFPQSEANSANAARIILLGLCSTAAIFGGHAIEWTAAGVICAILVACVANYRWQEDAEAVQSITESYGTLWNVVFMPLLFGLIGMKFKFDQISGEHVLISLAIIAIGLVGRLIVSIVVPMGSLRAGDSLYVALALLPKATVQAAFGPALLDYVVDFPEYRQDIELIVTACVLTIILTAPIGQLLLQVLAPQLLRKSTQITPITTYNSYDQGESAPQTVIATSFALNRSMFVKKEEDSTSLRM